MHIYIYIYLVQFWWQKFQMGSVLVPKPVIWESWGLHFGTLGDHLGDPGVPGDTLQDTWGSRPRFLSILGGFWYPFGTHFGVILVTFL